MGVRARARARLPVRRAPPATTFPNPDGGAGVSYLRCAAQITHRTGGRRRKRPCSGLIALVVATAFPGGWMDGWIGRSRAGHRFSWRPSMRRRQAAPPLAPATSRGSWPLDFALPSGGRHGGVPAHLRVARVG
jgi:hypothetical protein